MEKDLSHNTETEDPDVEKDLFIEKKTKVNQIKQTEFSEELLVEDPE